MFPGADSINTQIIRIPQPGFNPGMFESLEDSTGCLYDSLLSRNIVPTDLSTTSDTLFYMPALNRDILLKTAYQGAIIQDWTVFVIVLIFILIVSVRITNDRYLQQLAHSNFNITVARRLYGEQTYSFLHESFRIDLAFILTLAMLLFHIIHQFKLPHSQEGLGLYLVCFGGVLVWLLLKLGLYWFTASVFQSEEETSEYLYYHQTGTRFSGLVIYPLVFILFFTKGFVDNLIIFSGLIVLLFMSFSILIRGFGIIRKKVFSIYYPFLYLCTLEISPLILVGLLLLRLI